ncbi:MAG: hypothetical protein ACLTQG_30605 [Hungatella sp.]
MMIGLSPFEFLEGLSKWIKPKDNSLKSGSGKARIKNSLKV